MKNYKESFREYDLNFTLFKTKLVSILYDEKITFKINSIIFNPVINLLIFCLNQENNNKNCIRITSIIVEEIIFFLDNLKGSVNQLKKVEIHENLRKIVLKKKINGEEDDTVFKILCEHYLLSLNQEKTKHGKKSNNDDNIVYAVFVKNTPNNLKNLKDSLQKIILINDKKNQDYYSENQDIFKEEELRNNFKPMLITRCDLESLINLVMRIMNLALKNKLIQINDLKILGLNFYLIEEELKNFLKTFSQDGLYDLEMRLINEEYTSKIEAHREYTETKTMDVKDINVPNNKPLIEVYNKGVNPQYNLVLYQDRAVLEVLDKINRIHDLKHLLNTFFSLITCLNLNNKWNPYKINLSLEKDNIKKSILLKTTAKWNSYDEIYEAVKHASCFSIIFKPMSKTRFLVPLKITAKHANSD